MDRRLAHLALALAALAAALVCGGPARACQCDPDQMPVRDAFGWVDAVFEGTVVDIRTESATTGREGVASWSWARLRVGRAWKGVESGKEVLVGSGPDGSDCPDFVFSPGGHYLVYAHRGRYPFASLVAIVCTRTRPLERADADIRELDAIAKRSAPLAGPQHPSRGCGGCSLDSTERAGGRVLAAAALAFALLARRRRSCAARSTLRAARAPDPLRRGAAVIPRRDRGARPGEALTPREAEARAGS